MTTNRPVGKETTVTIPTFDAVQPITSQDNRHTGWLVTVPENTEAVFVVPCEPSAPRPPMTSCTCMPGRHGWHAEAR